MSTTLYPPTILLPSTKSVHQRALDLLDVAGIKLFRGRGGDTNIPLTGVTWPQKASFVHQSRIPQLVETGRYILGMVGLDSVRESGADVEVCADLLFNRSTWNKAEIVLVTDQTGGPARIPKGARVLTEYPRLTRAYFEKIGCEVEIVASRGSIESEIPDPYPYGVCLTETGQSLRANNLRIIGTLMHTSTVLIANKGAFRDDDVRRAVGMFKTILLGVIAAREKVMLVANVPVTNLNEVLAALPALRSPTVTALADKKYVSVSVVVPRADLNYLQERLLILEAEGLVVMPLTSLIQSREA
ncbi:ATP phosphoribosyltransferase [Candidatus Kaiserbacteria bacterium]|nr:ATP phosphoribosyltransferase [Candidatus Kaiserbacteria bacterium]